MKLSWIPRHPVGVVGAAMTLLTAISLIVLQVIDMVVLVRSPYVGLFANMVLPILAALSVVVLVIGVVLDRRRRKISPVGAPQPFTINFGNPRHRQAFATVIGIGLLVLLVVVAVGARAYQYTESPEFCGQLCHVVMKPEYVAYTNSPHARVGCAQCHVGPGASWWVKSKISGARQVVATVINSYPRPLPGAIQSLRPAQATCEQCHWPAKFVGTQLKLFTHYDTDEANTRHQIQLLLKTGGGATKGSSSGIHWHINVADEISYVAKDDLRQDIPWVRMKDPDGRVRTFQSTDAPLTSAQVAAAAPRRMDCIDCHNRPTHGFAAPSRAVDDSMFLRRIDASLPYIRREAVADLEVQYPTTAAAMDAISASLAGFYQKSYPKVWSDNRKLVDTAITEVQRIYSVSTFPEMKVDWSTYPTNIGHRTSAGCFRCHDGKHVAEDGSVITKDCNACHVILKQVTGKGTSINPDEPLGTGVTFVHPVDVGMDLKDMDCVTCHGPQKTTK
jgi:hypothetical protein